MNTKRWTELLRDGTLKADRIEAPVAYTIPLLATFEGREVQITGSTNIEKMSPVKEVIIDGQFDYVPVTALQNVRIGTLGSSAQQSQQNR